MKRRVGESRFSSAQRVARLNEIIARYERRGWKLGIRLDARAELIGRGTRRRYLEVTADGTTIDRTIDEQLASPPNRERRSLTKTATALLLLALVVGGAALGFSLNGSRSTGSRDGAGNLASPTAPEEQTLAATQEGDAPPDDALVQSFASDLDSLEQYCTESRGELGDFAVDANARLAVAGTNETLLSTLDEMVRAISDGEPPRDSCQDRLVSDLQQRGVAP